MLRPDLAPLVDLTWDSTTISTVEEEEREEREEGEGGERAVMASVALSACASWLFNLSMRGSALGLWVSVP